MIVFTSKHFTLNPKVEVRLQASSIVP